ncbi:MAG: GNAT family N-acetyltransferase [Bdellovibrio sp.]|nr:GNAT family N-acetyltransferase [Bdellovibrio sp.]
MTTVTGFPEEINGERIYLRKHDLTVVDEMFKTIDQNRERLGEFMPWPVKTQTSEDSKNYILMRMESWKQKALFDYGIYLNSGHKFVGNIGVHSIDWRSSRCELGYWISESYGRQGYTSEAVRLLEKVCFEKDFHRVEIRCAADNNKSAGVAIRTGYKLEGYLKDEKIENGRFRDTLIFAKLKSEVPSQEFVTLLGLDFVYLFVADIQASKQWYQKVFNQKPTIDLENYVEFRLGSSGLCLHFADDKSPLATGGSVGYWKVAQFENTINLFKQFGATIYRGPIDLPTSEKICQIKDPFSNVIGLIG